MSSVREGLVLFTYVSGDDLHWFRLCRVFDRPERFVPTIVVVNALNGVKLHGFGPMGP